MNFEQSPVSTPTGNANSRYGTLSVFDLTRMTIPTEKLAFGLACRQIEATEIAAVQKAMEHTGIYEPSIVAGRLADGRKGYIGEVSQGNDGHNQPHLATFGWVAFDAEPMGSTGIAFQPAPGDVWLFDFATLPECRGRGFYPTLLRYILADLVQQNIRLAWIGTAPGNDVSARSIARAGFQQVAYIGMVPSSDKQPPAIQLLPVPGIDEELLEAARKTHITIKDVTTGVVKQADG